MTLFPPGPSLHAKLVINFNSPKVCAGAGPTTDVTEYLEATAAGTEVGFMLQVNVFVGFGIVE